MLVRALPRSWLVHDIIYRQRLDGKDDYGNPLYAVPAIIKHVRFDQSTIFSRDKTQTKIMANAVIFVDTRNSTPIPDNFTEESIIIFDDKEYVLKKIVPCCHPKSSKVHHWELEVI
ncbi:putative minor capsid protein [Metasolibacillus meyeri]|uniref:putative minor capsid protein n=1 Tax=Metasolibacillus meyeri TaxID=1071052 RepID=UPI000D2FABD8|nr:putative minor capsid protein [Metasolibacillus meyeri]